MNPLLLLAVIAGGASGILVFTILGAGLVATPSPGSIFALMAMAPKGGLLPVLAGVAVATVVSFLVAAPFIKIASKNAKEEDLEEAKGKVNEMKNINKSSVKKIVFACDAGMGSSAMGASKFRNKIKELNLGIEVMHASVDEIPKDTDIVVTHKTLIDRAKKSCPNAELIGIQNFLTDDNIQNLYNRLANK